MSSSSSSVFGRFNQIKQLGPRNQGMSDIAQQRLNTVIAAANSQQENALAVDGTDIAVWQHYERGARCTCFNLKSNQEFLFSEPEKQPIAGSSITPTDEYQQNAEVVTFKIRGGKNSKAQARENTNFMGTLDKTDPSVPVDERAQEVDLDVQDQRLEDGQKALSDILATLDAGEDSGFLFGGDRTACGICFGTTYTEGYDLLNGHRYVFDASGAYSFSTQGFTLNKEDFPNSFESEYTSSNYVVWKNIELPTYFTTVLAVHTRNNTKPAESLIPEVSFDQGSTWATLTTDVLNAKNGVATTNVQFRVRPNASSVIGLAKFTHVEIVYQYAPYYRGQIPPETPSWSDVTKARALVNSTLSLSAKVPELKTFDVVFITKTNSLYKINDVTNYLTSKRQGFGYNSVGIRLLQSYEVLNLLRLAFNPVNVTAYTDREQIQGDLIYQTLGS